MNTNDITNKTKRKHNDDSSVSLAIELFNKSDVVLNCIQLLNVIDGYFHAQLTNIEPYKSSNDRNLYNCYPCIACSSNFIYQQSLQTHLERRNVNIRVYCMKCDSFKTFYNRCKLFYHVYSHKTYLTEPIYKDLNIEMIQLEKVIALNDRLSSIDMNDVNVMPITIQTSTKINEFLTQLEDNNYEAIKCCICEALFFNLEQLKQHYLNSKQTGRESTSKTILSSTMHSEYENDDESGEICDITGMDTENSNDTSLNETQNAAVNAFIRDIEKAYVESCSPKIFEPLDLSTDDLDFINKFSYKRLQFSTKCSILANLNLIYNKFCLYPDPRLETAHLTHIDIPLICPECGLCFSLSTNNKSANLKNQIENFRNHIITQCYYTINYSKQKCMKADCYYVFSSKREYIDHWTNEHIKQAKYCVLCQNEDGRKYLKLDTEAYINKHFLENHRDVINVANIKQFIKTAYICECQKDLCSFDIWKLCRKHYMQKLGISITYICCFLCKKNIHYPKLKSHLLTAHKIKSLIFCNLCGLVNDGSTNLLEHIKSAHKTTNNCLNMIKINKTDSLYLCVNCNLIFSSNCNFMHNCGEKAEYRNETNQYNLNFSPIYVKFNAYKSQNKDSNTSTLIVREDEENSSSLSSSSSNHQYTYDASTSSNYELVIEHIQQQQQQQQQQSDQQQQQQQQPIHRQQSKELIIENNNKNYVCDVCHTSFETQLYLNDHMRTHGLAYLKHTNHKKSKI